MENIKSNGIKAGDIFYTSWGYDQTNYEFIIVKEISKTGKTAICQRCTHQDMGSTGQCNIQKPISDTFGDCFRMQIQQRSYNGGQIVLRGSYPFCGDGKTSTGTRLDTFWKWDGKRTFYETDSQFGH